MSANPSGVKQYQLIRRYLSLIYLYGFFSREDFQKLMPEKTASYDVCIRHIKDIYPELLDGRYSEKRKYLAVDRGAQPGDEDRLCNTYFLSTLSEEEAVNVLQQLQETAREPVRINTLAESLADTLSKSTLRRRLEELVDFGWLEIDGKKRLRVPKNPLRALTPEELTDLYRYVRFCGNVTYPRVPARFLLRSIDREFLRRGLSLPRRPLFQFLNSPNHNILEEDLVYTLLEAAAERRQVEITAQRGHRRETVMLTPVALRIDQRLGRWYLMSMEDRPTIRRISAIREAVPGSRTLSPEDWEAARQAVDQAFAHSRFSGLVPETGPEALRMQLCFDEAPGLKRQFLRELRGGRIEPEGDREVLVDEINDPIELVPLLRSYSPWIRPVDPTCPAARRIRESLLQMRQRLQEEAES